MSVSCGADIMNDLRKTESELRVMSDLTSSGFSSSVRNTHSLTRAIRIIAASYRFNFTVSGWWSCDQDRPELRGLAPG